MSDLVDDWTVDDTETAGEILTLLGIGCDASKEPGADWRRDKIAKLIRARISQQDAELERLRREVEEFKALFEQRWNTDLRAKKRWQDANPDKPNIWPSRDDLLVWLMDQHDEARKAAFIEAAEIAVVFAGKHEPSYGLVNREIHEAILAVVAALRAKAEGENHG